VSIPFFIKIIGQTLGGAMDFLSNVVGGVNWEAIVQLTFVSMIMIAGPVVIFLLAFRGGDL
jgi:hypothetical protein